VIVLVAAIGEATADPKVKVTWRPPQPRIGDAAIVTVRGPADGAELEGTIGGRPITFFREAAGHGAVVGFDMELPPGRQAWRIEVRERGRPPRALTGTLELGKREFPVQRLTLPTPMVDLDPETERRAVAEGHALRTLYRTVTSERLWRGGFVRPIGGTEPGTGFGSRRIINGQPRAPHSGTDYAAPRGTPVVSVNDGRVALVADYFFPGRLVVVDHGLGLYTLYFHLDEIRVEGGERVTRGQVIGTVGSTGRATGPHLHFGAQVGPARIDPERLLGLPLD
jgi:murein DD-endopeptidase MepM/ murein hydrolase activator NlpD